MFIDVHMHEMTYSKDSFLKLDEIVRIAKEKGLGAVCITDHDSMGFRRTRRNTQGKQASPYLWGLSSIRCREISLLSE